MQPELFLIEGKISALRVGASTLNLLAPKQDMGNAIAGIAGAATDQFGTAANAAMVANYGGEDVDTFACYIGDHLIQGTFSRVFFSDGDYVKAVVAKQESQIGALYAHAVLRPSDGLLWMPYNTGRGVWAEFKYNMKWIFWGTVCMYLGFWIFSMFGETNLTTEKKIMVVAVPLILMFVMGLWGFKDSLPEGRLSTAVFRVLGFPNPTSLNLKGSSIVGRDGYIHEHSVFRYREIVKDDPHPAK